MLIPVFEEVQKDDYHYPPDVVNAQLAQIVNQVEAVASAVNLGFPLPSVSWCNSVCRYLNTYVYAKEKKRIDVFIREGEFHKAEEIIDEMKQNKAEWLTLWNTEDDFKEHIETEKKALQSQAIVAANANGQSSRSLNWAK